MKFQTIHHQQACLQRIPVYTTWLLYLDPGSIERLGTSGYLISCSILMRRRRAKNNTMFSSPYTVSGVFKEKVLVNRIECVPSLDCVYAALD
jgi:hypothetical protein